jgi:hypothetical protein
MPSSRATKNRTAASLRRGTCFLVFSLIAVTAGCNKHTHTSDPRLRSIDELLEAQLPIGTPLSRVSFFLTSRGYVLDSSGGSHTVVGIIRHIDTETLEPVTGRVTFHFDQNGKLVSYELERAPDNAQ